MRPCQPQQSLVEALRFSAPVLIVLCAVAWLNPPRELAEAWSSSADAVSKEASLAWRSSPSLSQHADRIVVTVAGSGIAGFGGDGGPATAARVHFPRGVAVGSDDAIYIADTDNHRIRKVRLGAAITTVAGDGSSSYGPDGGPATRSALLGPHDVATGPDGSLYIADTGNNRIRKVHPDGIITTIAGDGSRGYGGDGGPATAARLFFPRGVALGPDGSVYVADTANGRIRKVRPDRTIMTVAGSGIAGFGGDGAPATDARLYFPRGVAVGPDGSVYIADTLSHRVRKVGLNGIITTIAGSGVAGFGGDNGPATRADLHAPRGVAIGADGSVYIADVENSRVRKVSPDGTISSVAGDGGDGNGDAAADARLNRAVDVAVGTDGSLYIADTDNHRIRRLLTTVLSHRVYVPLAARGAERP